MAKRQGTFILNNYKHGIFWWLLIGWWWRPIRNIAAYFFASLFGFKKVQINKH